MVINPFKNIKRWHTIYENLISIHSDCYSAKTVYSWNRPYIFLENYENHWRYFLNMKGLWYIHIMNDYFKNRKEECDYKEEDFYFMVECDENI